MPTGNKLRLIGPALVILSGLPGSGKTTFASAITRNAAITMVESDAIRRSIARRPRYTPAENARVFAIAEERVTAALRNSEPVLFDATNLTARDRSRFLRAAREARAPTVAVRLTVPYQAARRRLARPRTGHSEAGIDVYHQMRERPEPFTIPVVVVDTRFDTNPSAGLVIALLTKDQ